MFKGFFKKEETKLTRPPPSTTGNTGSNGTNSAEVASGGGGFFNLAPVIKVTANPSGFHSNNSYSHSPSMGASSTNLNPSNPYQGPNSFTRSTSPSMTPAPAPVTMAISETAGSLFGGMSLKKNNIPLNNAEMKPLAGTSLFSGLDLGGSTTTPSVPINTNTSSQVPLSLDMLSNISSTLPVSSTPNITQFDSSSSDGSAKKRAQQAQRHSTGGFNYMDVVADRASNTSATSSANAIAPLSRHISKVGGVKKKKKPTFRPGFGRQLSEEAIAALQRGDIKEEDIMASDESNSSGHPTRHSTSSFAGSGRSVLAGLTVHTPGAADTDASASGSSKSILSGLTLQRGSST